MNPSKLRWPLSLAAAAILHATAFVWISTSPKPVAPIVLGSEAVELNFEVAAEVAAVAQPAVPEPAAPRPAEPAPAPERPPKPKPAPKLEPAPEPVPEPSPKPVAPEPAATTVSEPVPVEPAPASAPASAAPVATPSTARTRFTGKPARNVRSYFGQITAWIDANKDYPADVKKKKQQGTVVVKFTIGRDGRLLASSIKQSSGHALLDQAALSTLARAAPFPPIPDFVGRETLSVAVPIDYSLITE